jgi:hypothetical protein
MWFDRDGAIVILECRRSEVMAARAKETFLRKAYVVANGDLLKIEQPNSLADPRTVPDRQFPRPKNPYAVPYKHSLANRGPEASQQGRAKTSGQPPLAEEKVLNGKPKRLNPE